MTLNRRSFLTTLGTLAAGSALPPPMRRRISPTALDRLHAYSQSLTRRLDSALPLPTLDAALAQLRDVETLLPAAAGWQRNRLSRTAALTALVAVSASRHGDPRWTEEMIDRADQHAADASDGPLRAQALLYRARHTGEENYALDAGTQAGVALLTGALHQAGCRREQAALRAVIRYELAWECAALGDTRGARTELASADAEHDVATVAPPDVIVVWPEVLSSGALGPQFAGSVLRRLGLHQEAIASSTRGLAGPPSWRTPVMVDIARSHAALGDVDAAAAKLEDAFLTNVSAGLVGQPQGRVRAARALLHDTAAVRQLDVVMRG
jgi:tetratricopeptide (TPR) repeat protein